MLKFSTTAETNPPKDQWFDFDFKEFAFKAARFTPRLLIAGVTAYYILGYAYTEGWMAAIDKIAMKIMQHYKMGYSAIGALMPTIQWYAAWGVRITAGALAGLAYDLMERIIICSVPFFAPDESAASKTLPVINKMLPLRA